MTTTTYILKRNNFPVDTYADPVEAHKAALELAERTNDAVTIDPDPLHDLADFARDLPVNFRLACGYPGAKLGWMALPKQKYIICWKSLVTGFTGNGTAHFSFETGMQAVDAMNNKFSGVIHHWLQLAN